MQNQPLPAEFTRRILDVWPEAAPAWLAALPDLITECEQRWSLRAEPPFPDLSYNYVAPARRADGREVVLKLGVPQRELWTEIDALRLYAGQGAALLLDADPGRGVLLLERLSPGTPLAALPDDNEATIVAAGIMRQLWRPAPAEHRFPAVADWARGLQRLRATFGGTTGPFPRRRVEQAEALFADLLASARPPVLLHGDLHHANILAAERQPWLALDPKGLVGDPGYEVGPLLSNPWLKVATWPHFERVLARRLDVLAEHLSYDRERLRCWGLAQQVLSAWWTYEDHGRVGEYALRIADALDTEPVIRPSGR